MRRPFVLAFLVSTSAFAQVTTVGDIVVVRDPTGAITNAQFKQSTFCANAYNQARTVLPDVFDGIVSFSSTNSWMEMDNTWQGTPVRTAASGIGRGSTAGALLPNPFASYNGTKISECVFMGTLGQTQGLFPGFPGVEPLPMNPDDITRAFGGIFPHLTGIEMVGHEYGHHWMLGVEFNRNDGRGVQHYIRGYEDSGDPQQPGSPNQHYSGKAGSGSVMYGNCITDLGGGSFRIEGCPRKYSHLDQYLMGLRAPAEVQPMIVLDDGSGQGDPSQPMSRGTSSTVSGFTRYDVNADDVVRALGPRVPASGAGAQNCWRVAFVVVLDPSQTTIPTAMLQKVENYRARFGPWFNQATDGRGYMDTRLTGAGCSTVVSDGGVTIFDAGTPVDAGTPADAGTPEQDAGTPEVDAGTPEQDAGTPEADAGFVEQPGTDGGPVDPGPSKWETCLNCDTGKIRPGCGCGAPGGLEALGLALVLLLGARRAARRR